MSTEADAPVSTEVEALRAQSKERIASLTSAADTKAPEAKAEKTETAKPVDSSGDATETAKPAKPEAKPVADADLSYVPDTLADLRELAQKNPEVAAWLKKGTLLEADYTRKRMADAELRKQLDAEKHILDVGKTVLDDDELATLVFEHQRKRKSGKEAAAPEPVDRRPDPFTSTPEEIEAYEARREQRLIAKAKAEALAEFQQSLAQAEAPVKERREMANIAIAEFVTPGHYTAEQVDKAYDDAVAKAKKYNGSVTKANLVEALREFLPAKATSTGATSVAEDGSGTKVAPSPMARNGGRLSPVPPPKFVGEGRGPQTREERIAFTLWKTSQRVGHKVTLADFGSGSS